MRGRSSSDKWQIRNCYRTLSYHKHEYLIVVQYKFHYYFFDELNINIHEYSTKIVYWHWSLELEAKYLQNMNVWCKIRWKAILVYCLHNKLAQKWLNVVRTRRFTISEFRSPAQLQPADDVTHKLDPKSSRKASWKLRYFDCCSLSCNIYQHIFEEIWNIFKEQQ